MTQHTPEARTGTAGLTLTAQEAKDYGFVGHVRTADIARPGSR
ncbi:hypothetical protein [Amycolatopsis sp. CA-126428]|nr:hypothetical protein [Amycolatopsis sp. CA-126428]